MIQFCIRAVPAAHCCVSEGRLCTLGSPVVALLMQAQGGAPSEGSSTSSTSLVRLVVESSPFSTVVLLLLLLLSIISWGIILYKLSTYRAAEKHTAQFIAVSSRTTKFSDRQTACRALV